MGTRTAAAFGLSIAALAILSCGKRDGSVPQATGEQPPLPTKISLDSYKQWDTPPQMTIDTKKIYIVSIATEKGNITIQLFADKAPVNVNNFIFLINSGFYDNLSFYRVLPDFLAQAGKPPVEALYGPGYRIKDEIAAGLGFDAPGVVAMASQRNEPNSNGSMFFITLSRAHWLNGKFTIIGRVVEGLEVLEKLTPVSDSVNYEYGGDVIKKMTVGTSEHSLIQEKSAVSAPRVPVLTAGRPLSVLPFAEREYIYDTMPQMTIDKDRVYRAKIETSKGTVEADLFPEDAPLSVNNFYILANLGYYDNTPISFIQLERYVLFGSPGKKPESDVGYPVPEEQKRQIRIGAIGYFLYARQDGTSSGSNVFMMLTNDPHIPAVTVFGQITAGIDIVKKLELSDIIKNIEVKAK